MATTKNKMEQRGCVSHSAQHDMCGCELLCARGSRELCERAARRFLMRFSFLF